jgi:putative transcriptional regulator
MLSPVSVAVGRGLIAEPFMPDPFKRAVVLLTEYSAEGAVGFILNQLSEFLLGDLLPEVSYSEIPVYIGGPVENNTLHFIHCCPEKIENGNEIVKGVYWGGDFDKVMKLISNYQLSADEIRFFSGYSGWSARQLDNEIKEDSWIVTNKLNRETIFTQKETSLWRQEVISLGKRYAHIANFPENPSLN